MLRSVLFTALLALSASATAQDFDYSFFSVGYSQIDIDDEFIGVGVDGDAFGAAGSYELNENIFLFGSLQVGELEASGFAGDVDVTVYDVGLGYRMPLSDTVDFFGTVAYEYQELEDQGVSIDDNGFGIGVGLRARVSQSIELNGGIQYVDLGDMFGDDTAFTAGGQFALTDNVELGLSGSWGDDLSIYTLSGRFYFGD